MIDDWELYYPINIYIDAYHNPLREFLLTNLWILNAARLTDMDPVFYWTLIFQHLGGVYIIWAVKMVPGRLEELWGVRMCTVFVSFNFLRVQLSDFHGYNGRHFDPQKSLIPRF